MRYIFEWDPQKARRNRRAHGVAFEHALTVFRDPLMLSVYDEEHSSDEERWLTLGLSERGGLLVVHHTFEEIYAETVRIRIISSRKATTREARSYGRN